MMKKLLQSMKAKISQLVLGTYAFSTTSIALAGTTATTSDSWAEPFHDWVSGTATGLFARAVCLVGGIVGLITAALNGKLLIAAIGIALAFVGVMGPQMIDAIFLSAVV